MAIKNHSLISHAQNDYESHDQSPRNLALSTLTFEGGPGNNQLVGNFYNGGAGGNLGISIPNSIFAVKFSAGGSWGLSNEPSPVAAMYFLDDSNAFININNGFTYIEFFYSSNF